MLDFTQLYASRADKLARSLGVPLASVTPSVRGEVGSHASVRTNGPDPPGPELSPLEVTRAAQKAIALAQQGKHPDPADLVKHVFRRCAARDSNPEPAD